jgi:hypothetical protein
MRKGQSLQPDQHHTPRHHQHDDDDKSAASDCRPRAAHQLTSRNLNYIGARLRVAAVDRQRHGSIKA